MVFSFDLLDFARTSAAIDADVAALPNIATFDHSLQNHCFHQSHASSLDVAVAEDEGFGAWKAIAFIVDKVEDWRWSAPEFEVEVDASNTSGEGPVVERSHPLQWEVVDAWQTDDEVATSTVGLTGT